MSIPYPASVMHAFDVDQQLLDNCVFLFETRGISYLLHKNAQVIWIVLVPHTDAVEFYQLPPEQLQWLCTEINRISANLERAFACDQLNVTTGGDEVEQMHVHIVCRRSNDGSLPEDTWDKPIEVAHSETGIRRIAKIIAQKDCEH
jgi:diadenosine tetraphosphate (Ap4A) HIT family hydrolase